MSERRTHLEFRIAWQGGETGINSLADALVFVNQLGQDKARRCYKLATVVQEKDIQLLTNLQTLPTTQQTVRTLHQQAANSDS